MNFVKSLRKRAAEGAFIEDDEIRKAVELTNSSIELLSSSPDVTSLHTLTLISQFLANVSVTPSAARTATWKAFHPTILLHLSLIQNIDILDPLCYALWNFAKDEFYTPVEKGRVVFDNLVQFFGSDQGSQKSTAFSLLLGYCLEHRHETHCTTPAMIKAIGKMDVDCVNSNAASQLQGELLELARGQESHEVLSALRNCTLKSDSQLSLLKEIAEWSVMRLNGARGDDKGRDGLQTDLTALLSDLIWDRAEVQNYVLDLNGLELVLNGIRLDESNQFLREWSLLFVRGMCTDNDRAKDFIQRLELKEVATDESLGMHIEYDKITGKFSVQKN